MFSDSAPTRRVNHQPVLSVTVRLGFFRSEPRGEKGGRGAEARGLEPWGPIGGEQASSSPLWVGVEGAFFSYLFWVRHESLYGNIATFLMTIKMIL